MPDTFLSVICDRRTILSLGGVGAIALVARSAKAQDATGTPSQADARATATRSAELSELHTLQTQVASGRLRHADSHRRADRNRNDCAGSSGGNSDCAWHRIHGYRPGDRSGGTAPGRANRRFASPGQFERGEHIGEPCKIACAHVYVERTDRNYGPSRFRPEQRARWRRPVFGNWSVRNRAADTSCLTTRIQRRHCLCLPIRPIRRSECLPRSSRAASGSGGRRG